MDNKNKTEEKTQNTTTETDTKKKEIESRLQSTNVEIDKIKTLKKIKNLLVAILIVVIIGSLSSAGILGHYIYTEVQYAKEMAEMNDFYEDEEGAAGEEMMLPEEGEDGISVDGDGNPSDDDTE